MTSQDLQFTFAAIVDAGQEVEHLQMDSGEQILVAPGAVIQPIVGSGDVVRIGLLYVQASKVEGIVARPILKVQPYVPAVVTLLEGPEGAK